MIPSLLFWSRGFVPHRKWNFTVLVRQNAGKENRGRNFTSGVIQNRETKIGDWEWLWRHFRTWSLWERRFLRHFLINNALSCHSLAKWLTHNKNMTQKSVFREALSPEMKWRHNDSQSPVLVSRFCAPSEVKFHVFGTSKHGEGKSLSNNFFCYTYQYIGKI